MSKKAFLVGVNAYLDPINSLRGCVNDVIDMSSVLQRYFGFESEDIKFLTNKDATRQAILDGLDWLVEGAQAGDVLVFHYSGHGSYVADDGDDEYDCRDEILVPHDHDWSNPLRDDHIREKLLPVPPGANLTFISDSCHSGSVNKLATPYEAPRSLLVPDEIQRRIAMKIARRDADFSTLIRKTYHEMARTLAPAELNAQMDQFLARLAYQQKLNRFGFVDTQENNILVAACQDQQTSVETVVAGDWHGALSYNLVKAITEAGGALTYQDLITRAGEGMLAQRQVPQLECPADLKAHSIFGPLVS